MMMASMDGADQAPSGVAPLAPAAPTGATVAATIAANVDARWPGGCAVATATGADVAIVYTDCTGPRGLVHVTGELDLAVTVSLAGGISVHATATDIEVNGATLTIDATGDYAVTGTAHTLTVTTHGTGTGPRGNEIDHDGDYTISWDPTTLCHSIDGSWSTDFSNAAGSKDRSNMVDIDRCPNMCPSGTLEHTFLGGLSLTITLDGTTTATWALSTGGSGTIALTCGS
jgi:hypothetical protein